VIVREPVDWGHEFAVVACVYGWTPEKIATLTMQQFECLQKYAHKRLAEQEVRESLTVAPRKLGTGQQLEPMKDNTDQFAAAALRLKEKQGVKGKISIPIGKVWEEMKHGG